MSAREETTSAFLLRSFERGESDRILTLFTEKRGKLSGLAKGARKSRRRFGGSLEPFALIEVTIRQTRGNLYHLVSARTRSANLGLAEDLGRTRAAALILEIVREVMPENEPDANLFSLLEETLSELSRAGPSGIGPVEVAAILKVLSLAGIDVSVDRCAICGRSVPEAKKVLFNKAKGGVVCTPCGGGPAVLTAKAALALCALKALSPSEAVHHPLSETALKEIHGALIHFVEYHIERPLSSSLPISK